MPMDNVTLENTQQSISSRDAKSVASVMVNGKWVNLSDTLEQANVKSDVGTVAKQVAAQQEVVSNAVSTADSAQSAADAAVASARVTSDAVSAIASATAEAKQGANDAMSQAQSAWDVATNAKSAVTDFDPLLKQAQSDAKAAGSSAVALRADVDKVTSLVNDPKTGLNVTYQTAAGNATTISNVKSDVYQLETTANGLTSRVGNLESKTNTQETAIEQNKNTIALKADQTAVDKINGTVSQLQSSLTVQAGQIQEKVTSSQVAGMLTGYATQEYTQSLITQKAGTINESITNLDAKYSAKDGVNLATDTGNVSSSGAGGGWGNIGNISVDTLNELRGQYMTISVDVEWNGWKNDGKFPNNRLGWEIALAYKDGSPTDYYGAWLRPTTANGKQRIYGTYMVPDKEISLLGEGYAYIQISCTSAKVSHLKIERGTVATPWTPAPSDNATVTQVQSLTASIDGLQSNVTNLKNDTSSQITQLSNVVQSKVSQGDYNSQINQLKNDINLRVQKGNVISQINQEAGGNTLIQVSNGNGSLILDAANTIVKGKEWIPVAAIADLTADQIQAGTLKGVKVDFRDSTGTGMIADGSTLTFDVSNTPAGYLSYNGMPVAELPDGSGGNELAIRYGLSTAIIPDDNSGAQATFSKAAQKIAYMTGTNQGKQMLSGLEVHSNNHHWLCAVNSDATCNRFEVNDRDGLNIAWHDNTHFFISDGNAKLYQDNNDSPTATKLEIHGWAWVNGWVEAAGHSQHSALSTKTDIQPVDDDKMLKMVNDTDLTTFLYKTDVASGETHRHIGLIIDDVHDVAQYQTPQDFIAPNGVSRDDDNMIGALFGAVKALTKRIKILESKVG
ncbi:hypothetical protein HCY00_07150 [Limosilactobacillus fermentum]